MLVMKYDKVGHGDAHWIGNDENVGFWCMLSDSLGQVTDN
jgi:hypothetical protein